MSIQHSSDIIKGNCILRILTGCASAPKSWGQKGEGDEITNSAGRPSGVPGDFYKIIEQARTKNSAIPSKWMT
jgi:hypothetical protein